MARSRVVRPETASLTISDGDTLTVKRRLNAGEQRKQYDRMYRDTAIGRTLDPLQMSMSLILAYLLDWSLVYPDGKRIEINGKPEADVIAALESLDYDSFKEIKEAIEAHEAAMDKERADAKKTHDGATTSSAISPSPADSAGDTNGLPNSTPMSMAS